jgi:NAD(P)-dependent dehydrogenase (short-subunit alcohol dehydrogenase family)
MDIANLEGKTVLVTGAASGIGKETALAFGRRGASLVVCDVNEVGLAETERTIRALGREVLARRVDVANRAEMGHFAEAVHAQVGALDVLVNNAGVGLGGGFLDTGLDDWDWIVGINFWGVIHGCHFFLPPMVKRGRGGHVVNVSSAAGYVASAPLCAYATTKFGVFGLSEALRQELVQHGIGVTTVCPGIINTPITRSSRMLGPDGTEAARQRIVRMYERRNYGPERVARNILRAVERNRAVAPISAEAWAMYYVKRLAPGLIDWFGRVTASRLRRQIAAKSGPTNL